MLESPHGQSQPALPAMPAKALAPATLAVTGADWADSSAWCRGRGVVALPTAPVTVAADGGLGRIDGGGLMVLFSRLPA